jgi:putative DNA primase/helicase
MGSGNGKAGAAMEEGELPADLLALIRDGVEVGRRSEQFHHAVGWLKQLGWTVAGIISLFEKYPEGIAEKYAARLQEEVERSFGKLSDPTAEELVAKLTAMSAFEYARARREFAQQLDVPVTALDKEVRSRRASKQNESTALPHWHVEPWETPVDGAVLLEAIRKELNRYCVLPKHGDLAIGLWVLHAWTLDACDITPFLALSSPEKRCGKTRVLIVLYWLTPRSELASNISASALFRYVEDVCPTLLIDEADSFVRDNEELRGILNCGHTRTASHVIRNVEINGAYKARRFSTWAPKAIATIRVLADTHADRSIIIPMQRKAPSQPVERLRSGDTDEFRDLRSQARRWAEDHVSSLANANPEIPKGLNDRQADNWRPLLAIAEAVGGNWPSLARDAAKALSGTDLAEDSISVELLTDVSKIFETLGVPEITTTELVAELVKDDARPWAHWKHDKPITARALARMLKPFHVFPQEVYHPARGQGYVRELFEQACAPYIPPSKLGSSGNATGTGISRYSKSSEEGQAPSFDKAREIVAAMGAPKLPSFETASGGRALESGARAQACAQCGEDDGKTSRYPGGLWFHRVCRSFWLHAQSDVGRCGSL